jgi:O-methyltransferase involved in polyketide biosynthesis
MQPGVDLRIDVPHSARIYDYLLGGKDNFAADREAAEQIRRDLPTMPISMRANRQFVGRVARWLAAERGMRQFVDIGTGLPTSPNLHEAAQAVDPTCRVVYIDNDPLVLVHARALLSSSPEGKTSYVDADLHDVNAILAAEEFTSTLDLTQPIAVSVIAVLQHLLDEDLVHDILARLMDAMPSGSTLALSVPASDNVPEQVQRAVRTYNARGVPNKARTYDEVQALFKAARVTLLDPGVVLVHKWHPDEDAKIYRWRKDPPLEITDQMVHMYGGVGVKP